MTEKFKLGIIGLGYVGLPLAVAFAKKYDVIGFDINQSRVDEISKGEDSTLEISNEELDNVLKDNLNQIKNKGLTVTCQSDALMECNFFIITVPTPIDENKNPDLTPLIKASQTVGNILKKEDIVVFESTVFPGATEEICVPQLEKSSGLKFNQDFFVGYSPERINPGDKLHTVTKIKKVTSGSTDKTAMLVDKVYSSIIEAGTFLAKSIRVAEAAKVIENAQRDINIAFMNELSKIFELLHIETSDVLEAASTKWNFLNFSPGLVGGHCIGVDPYYLAQKAQEVGYYPEIILSGRRINDSMGKYVAANMLKLIAKSGNPIQGSNILIAGFTFKENCPDYRNTKIIDVYDELISFGFNVEVYDPWIKEDDIVKNYPYLNFTSVIMDRKYHGIIIGVAHETFKEIKWANFKEQNGIIYDLKGHLNKNFTNKRL